MADVTVGVCGPGTGYPPMKVGVLFIIEDT